MNKMTLLLPLERRMIKKTKNKNRTAVDKEKRSQYENQHPTDVHSCSYYSIPL